MSAALISQSISALTGRNQVEEAGPRLPTDRVLRLAHEPAEVGPVGGRVEQRRAAARAGEPVQRQAGPAPRRPNFGRGRQASRVRRVHWVNGVWRIGRFRRRLFGRRRRVAGHGRADAAGPSRGGRLSRLCQAGAAGRRGRCGGRLACCRWHLMAERPVEAQRRRPGVHVAKYPHLLVQLGAVDQLLRRSTAWAVCNRRRS